MNGISSNLLEEIKKSGDIKKKQNFKFAACIVTTNLMVALLCWQSPPEIKLDTKISKTLHSDYQIMEIPLSALISESSRGLSETPVTIISKDKKVIAQKAWLHEEVKKDSNDSYFKVEVSNADIVKVSEGMEVGLVAIPYVEQKAVTIKKRGPRYEVSI